MNTKTYLGGAPVVNNNDLIKLNTNMINVLGIDYAELHYFQEKNNFKEILLKVDLQVPYSVYYKSLVY